MFSVKTKQAGRKELLDFFCIIRQRGAYVLPGIRKSECQELFPALINSFRVYFPLQDKAIAWRKKPAIFGQSDYCMVSMICVELRLATKADITQLLQILDKGGLNNEKWGRVLGPAFIIAADQ